MRLELVLRSTPLAPLRFLFCQPHLTVVHVYLVLELPPHFGREVDVVHRFLSVEVGPNHQNVLGFYITFVFLVPPSFGLDPYEHPDIANKG